MLGLFLAPRKRLPAALVMGGLLAGGVLMLVLR